MRGSISSWGLLNSLLLLWGSWIVWSLWLISILWLSISLLSEWILLNLLWSNHLSLNWLSSVLNWLLLDNNWSLLLNNSSYWLLSRWSLGRDGSVLFHSGVSLLSSCLYWFVVNWLLLSELSIHSLLLSVWRVSELIDWTLGGILWINSSLLLQVRFITLELFSFLKVSSSISVVEHVSELIVDHLDLLVGQSISFSIDQTLDSSKLVNENKLWVVSLIVDSIKISLQQLLVQHVGRSLAHRHVEDSTGDFEKVLNNVILICSSNLQVRLDQKVLLRLFQESIKLSVLLLEALVRIKEMKSLDNINEI